MSFHYTDDTQRKTTQCLPPFGAAAKRNLRGRRRADARAEMNSAEGGSGRGRRSHARSIFAAHRRDRRLQIFHSPPRDRRETVGVPDGKCAERRDMQRSLNDVLSDTDRFAPHAVRVEKDPRGILPTCR
jgi:hypothetical protein